MIHTRRMPAAEGMCRAMMEGTRNMPAPMIVPTTSEHASQRVSCRRRCVELVMPSMDPCGLDRGETEAIINDRGLGDLSSPTHSYMELSGGLTSAAIS